MDGASLFAGFNVFSNNSQGSTWMPFEVFRNGEDADGAQRTAFTNGRGQVGSDDRTTAEGKDFNMFQAMNIFEEAKDEDEDEDAWVDMAASMDEHLRKRSTGMDVRLMQDDDLEELFSKIGRRLQQAKESSQAHSGRADGDYVLRTVTVWEINFWEGCEMSKALRYLRASLPDSVGQCGSATDSPPAPTVSVQTTEFKIQFSR